MKKLKNIFLQIGRIKALKYVLVSVIAIVLIGFVDENSVWRHIKNKQTISDLQEEVQKYSELNRRNQEQIRLLDSNPKAIGFIYRNVGQKQTLQEAVRTVDEIERLTGIDFFPALEDGLERKIEAEARLSDW